MSALQRQNSKRVEFSFAFCNIQWQVKWDKQGSSERYHQESSELESGLASGEGCSGHLLAMGPSFLVWTVFGTQFPSLNRVCHYTTVLELSEPTKTLAQQVSQQMSQFSTFLFTTNCFKTFLAQKWKKFFKKTSEYWNKAFSHLHETAVIPNRNVNTVGTVFSKLGTFTVHLI